MNAERDEHNQGLALDAVLRAAETALEGAKDVSAVILAASGGLPADASEFDRGLAAGVALARYLAAKSA